MNSLINLIFINTLFFLGGLISGFFGCFWYGFKNTQKHLKPTISKLWEEGEDLKQENIDLRERIDILEERKG